MCVGLLNSFFSKILTSFIKFEFEFEFVLLFKLYADKRRSLVTKSAPVSSLISTQVGMWMHARQHSKPTSKVARPHTTTAGPTMTPNFA